jgi:NAD(P)-dependent dehydrogenase (short-subunit alcohol dehydrogenase family)
MKTLEGKVAAIMGGSSGIGLATARLPGSGRHGRDLWSQRAADDGPARPFKQDMKLILTCIRREPAA